MEDLHSGDPNCPICMGMGRVCEDHPLRVCEHDDCAAPNIELPRDVVPIAPMRNVVFHTC